MKKTIRRGRVDMRLPKDLLKWARSYAKKRKMTFTQVIVDLLSALKVAIDE